MPVHDWSRVRAGKFHHFHNSWIYKLSDRLNGGILPPGYYAAGEQVAGDVEPDVLTLQHLDPPPADPAGWPFGGGAVALQEHPPQVSYTMQAEAESYRRKQDHLVIRSSDPDRIVALIEIVSRSNKDSRRRIDQFLRKIAAAFDAGYHALVIDLHPSGAFDPQGIHGTIWDYLFGTCPPAPPDRPSTLVSYCVEPPVTAYVEPLAVGARLPDMPLFLAAGWYVNVPLEETYSQTWEGFPAPWKEELRPGA
jgi:hypothetical protein